MKIIVVGGTGTIGKAVVNELSPRHEIIIATHEKGDIKVDITDAASIEKMYKTIGKFDAVISTVGKVEFRALSEMGANNYSVGLKDKLMGQVNLVLIGQHLINDGGSFTLTSGILSCDPIRFGTSAAMVNGALNSFTVAAAIELQRAIRINCVSPTIVTEAMGAYGEYFRGYDPVPTSTVALAYSKSVEGLQTGKVFKVGY